MEQFKHKVVLVTGGSTGIGRATAHAFARQGARVVIADIAHAAGEEAVALIRGAGGEAVYVNADMSEPEQIAGLVRNTVKTFGRLDIAFNNAGIEGMAAPLGELLPEAWNRVISINLTAVFLCMQHEIRQMLVQGEGVIINNASILGQVGFAGASAYVAAKHGVLGLTQCATLEYGTRGIRVNAVCPGFIETPMLERAGLTGDEQTRKIIENLHALKRMGRPEEVAEAVLFLASPRASFVAGHALFVDGGFVAQ